MRNRIIFRIIFSFFTFIILAMMLIMFANNLDENLHKQITTTLDEVTKQSVKLVDKEIGTQTALLVEISSSIGKNEVFDPSTAQAYIKTVVGRHNFKRLGVATLDGKTYTTDDVEMNLSEREYFQQVVKGNNAISNLLEDYSDDEQIVVFAVPVFNNQNEVEAILFGTYSILTLNQIILTSSFDGQCYSYITTKTGDIVAKAGKTRNVEANDNILDILLEVDERNVKKQITIKNNIAQNKGGLTIVYNEVEKYLQYSPLTANDEWYIMNIVPVSVMNNIKDYIMSVTYGISAILIVASLTLIIYSAVSSTRKQKKLENTLYKDNVTGCDSYHSFIMKVKEILKNTKEQYAFVTMDITNFKLINELYGYEKGNDTLCYLSSVWKRWIKDDEVFCRRIADHYIALIKFSSKQTFERRIELFIDVLQNEYLELKKGYVFQPKFGIYIISDSNEDIDSICNHSTIAFAEVKKQAGVYYGYYDPQSRDVSLKIKYIEDDMRNAYRNKEFFVYYQPKYDTMTKKIIGAEALVRWHKPDGTIVMPSEFIWIAEKNGFIIDLDEYIFNHTCRQQRIWLEKGIEIVPISVNVSREHLKDEVFVRKYQKIRNNYDLPDESIQVEITESAIFDNKNKFITVANELHSAGFSILMDDFGTGYSSFTMLKDIPIDVMKLDRSFIEDSNTDKGRKIIKSIMDLARSLNIKITAEGVENENQYLFLKELRCDMIQGYYFAKPMRRVEFEKLLTKKE